MVAYIYPLAASLVRMERFQVVRSCRPFWDGNDPRTFSSGRLQQLFFEDGKRIRWMGLYWPICTDWHSHVDSGRSEFGLPTHTRFFRIPVPNINRLYTRGPKAPGITSATLLLWP